MTAMREGINKQMGDTSAMKGKAFPYSFEFLYWEEVGIIDAELMRNLAICGAVVIVRNCGFVFRDDDLSAQGVPHRWRFRGHRHRRVPP